MVVVQGPGYIEPKGEGEERGERGAGCQCTELDSLTFDYILHKGLVGEYFQYVLVRAGIHVRRSGELGRIEEGYAVARGVLVAGGIGGQDKEWVVEDGMGVGGRQ